MDVDSETMDGVLRRLKRAQGQIGGVIKMIEEGRDCADVVTQLAAGPGRSTGLFKIIATGLQQCAVNGGGAADADRAQLERLFLSLAEHEPGGTVKTAEQAAWDERYSGPDLAWGPASRS